MQIERHFPAFRGQVSFSLPEPAECVCCGNAAVARIQVATGDLIAGDTWEPVCDWHRKMAMQNWHRFRAHWATKGRYLAGKSS